MPTSHRAAWAFFMAFSASPSKATRPPSPGRRVAFFIWKRASDMAGKNALRRFPSVGRGTRVSRFSPTGGREDTHPHRQGYPPLIPTRTLRGGVGSPRTSLPGRERRASNSPAPFNSQHDSHVTRIVRHVILRPCRPSKFPMATDADSIPDGFEETMESNNWSEAEREAWKVLHEAKAGDYVLWADRSVAMEVESVEQDEEGHHVLHAKKPRGEGTYEVHERYNNGKPKFTSPIGRANNLHFVERAPDPRGLTEEEYEELVVRLGENAIDAFRRMDYGEWEDAVSDVVETWSDDVAFEQWAGYKHHPDWESDDPGEIFDSVLEHATFEGYPEDASLKTKATVALHDAVYRSGRNRAEESLVTSQADYVELVEKLAHHSLDRFDRKNYSSARVAVRDTVSDWIDDRRGPAQQSVIEYGDNRFDDMSVYEGEEQPERELAFDILDHDVWEEVQELQRDRGEHDPTIRGLTYTNYQELVDYLVEQTMREYTGHGLLRTTVKHVVDAWADEVEARAWEGHRHRVYAAGDVEDIFASVAIHSDADPFVFNIFSSKKERKLAVNALIPEVLEAAERTLDERGALPVAQPADDYLQTLNLPGLSEEDGYESMHTADEEEVRSFLNSVLESTTGDEVGWTFVEEILEAGGTVPQSTNDWSLIDYGVVRQNENLRKLAWFNRETGDVLVISGLAQNDMGGLYAWDEQTPFHVQKVEYGGDEPEHLLTDVSLEEAMDYVRDYIDADRADIEIIEDEDDVYVAESIDMDDINAGGVLDALVPNIDLGTDDITALAGSTTQGTAQFLRRWWPELTGVVSVAALVTGHYYLAGTLLGTNLKPNIHRKKGVGVHATRKFGKDPGQSGVGGEIDADIFVRNETFSRLADQYAPKFVQYGFDEGDLGKGAVVRAGKGLDSFRNAFGYTFEDEVVPEIRDYGDLDDVDEETVRDLARRSNRNFESEEAWDDIDELRSKVYGYAKYYEPETVSWGQAFLDTYGGSVERLEAVLRRGSKDALDESMSEQTVGGIAETDEAVDDMVQSGEYDPDEFSWLDIYRTDIGLSGILLRGLEAEDVVAGAEFLNIDKWLKDNLTFHGSDYVSSDPPTFEEWQNKRFGPGKPGGPEEEARRMARYHKEVAAAPDPPDPVESLGYAGDNDPDGLGDFNLSQYTDEFGNAFDSVAEKFSGDSPVEPDHEVEDGHE